jgi:hypothetical protein
MTPDDRMALFIDKETYGPLNYDGLFTLTSNH